MLDPLVQIAIDESRNILYSRSEKGVIQVRQLCVRVCVCMHACTHVHACVLCVCTVCKIRADTLSGKIKFAQIKVELAENYVNSFKF